MEKLFNILEKSVRFLFIFLTVPPLKTVQGLDQRESEYSSQPSAGVGVGCPSHFCDGPALLCLYGSTGRVTTGGLGFCPGENLTFSPPAMTLYDACF